MPISKIGVFVLFSVALFAAPDNSVLIKNVTIHLVSAPAIANGSVLVLNGKIAEVGIRVSGAGGARVVDGRGLHLYPGLINAATNVGLVEVEAIRDTVDVDEIGEFNPELRAQIAFNPSSEHVPVTRAAGITSVLTLPGSGSRGGPFSGQAGAVIGGQAALMHLDGWTWEEMAVRPSAVMEMLFPAIADVPPPSSTPPPPAAASARNTPHTFQEAERQYQERLAGISRFLEDVRRYQKAKAAAAPGFRRDLKLEAMLGVIAGSQPLFIRAERERMIRDAIAFSDHEKVKIIIANPSEIGSVGPALKEHGIPVVLGNVLELPQHDDDAYDTPYTLPYEFWKAGVKFCFGSFDVQFARNVALQAAQAAAFGLPKEEALKAVTLNSAEILGAGAELGSITKGKIADLILTDGDPLEARTHIQQMFIAGRQVSLESRHTREYEIWLKRP